MTIVLGVAAPDGIILAADSRTTMIDGERHRIASDFAQKLFPIRDKFALATYGLSFIGQQTIAGHMDEIVTQLPDPLPQDIDEIANLLGGLFQERLEEQFGDELDSVNGDVLGFLVAGYDEGGIGHIREVGLPGPNVSGDINTANIGVLWRGQTAVIGRLIKGADLGNLFGFVEEVDQDLLDALGQLEYQLLLPIALQDAIDFSTFLIRTTIDMERFSDGLTGLPGAIPTCGGPIRIIAVTRAGVEWIEERPLSGPTAPGLAEGTAAT
jgi:hypothetical protein